MTERLQGTWRGFVLVLALLLALAGWSVESFALTILHTNDLHGMMRPFDYPGMILVQPKRDNAGGLARRATLIAKLRAEATNPLALIDTGDVFTRGPWHTRFYGIPEIEAYNLIGYDLFVVGNNEFKATDGIESQGMLLTLMRRSQFPWLAANVTVGETGVPVEGIHPFIVRTYGGVRVGYLGLTAPRSAEYPQTKGWTIADPIAVAKIWVPRARQECDVLIAVTHIGTDLDTKLAETVPGIDAIIGGDSHTFLAKPKRVQSPEKREVPILQAGEQGIMLGKCDLTFEKEDGGTWTLVKSTGVLLPIDDKLAEDPAIKTLLDGYLHAPLPQPKAPAVLKPAA